MKIAVLFPGQGSQFVGMGAEFLSTDKDAREIMNITEDVCKAPLGDLCVNGPMEELSEAKHLQPAITAVNLICWQQLQKCLNGLEIACFAGHSLGEYSALYAAGVLRLDDTIKIVAKRGELMGREGEKKPGGMRAVLGLNIEEVEKIVASVKSGYVTVANHNTEKQVVISGDLEGLELASEKAKEAGAKVIALPVTVANHSEYVAGAVPDFTYALEEIRFSPPAVPVIFNATAAEERDITAIKNMMAGQIISRVRWFETIRYMLALGVDTFIEAGPKAVLSGMVKKIKPKGGQCVSMQFDSPRSLEACLARLKN